MAMEFKGKGAHVLLGPVAGPLGRSGYGGRNWEGFSPDPWLTGVLFADVGRLVFAAMVLLVCVWTGADLRWTDYRRHSGDRSAGLRKTYGEQLI